jgi:carbon-monoxide dehydrogenase medium subunit
MFSPSFDYFRASSVDEARRLLHEHPGAKVLAGGHSLLPLLKMRLKRTLGAGGRQPHRRAEGITASGSSSASALTTHSGWRLRRRCDPRADPSEAAAMIGDPQVRNFGTIGGNVAHAVPRPTCPPFSLPLTRGSIVLALTASALPIGEFLQGMMTTALAPDEILTAIEVPARAADQGMAYVKFSHPASYTRSWARLRSCRCRRAPVRPFAWPWAGCSRLPSAVRQWRGVDRSTIVARSRVPRAAGLCAISGMT